MTLDDLRTLHEAMPPGSAISLSREALGELLGELIQPDADVRKVWDLTLLHAAHSVGWAPSMVRAWCGGADHGSLC